MLSILVNLKLWRPKRLPAGSGPLWHIFRPSRNSISAKRAYFWISRFAKEVYAVGLPQKQVGSLTENGAKERHDLVAQLCRLIRPLRTCMFPRNPELALIS